MMDRSSSPLKLQSLPRKHKGDCIGCFRKETASKSLQAIERPETEDYIERAAEGRERERGRATARDSDRTKVCKNEFKPNQGYGEESCPQFA